MSQVVTVRSLDRFDPRVDVLRRACEPDFVRVRASMDAYDRRCTMHLVAYFEGDAVATARLRYGYRTPLVQWVPGVTIEQGDHVADFNRYVVAPEFEYAGLEALLLAEATIAAQRIGLTFAGAQLVRLASRGRRPQRTRPQRLAPLAIGCAPARCAAALPVCAGLKARTAQ